MASDSILKISSITLKIKLGVAARMVLNYVVNTKNNRKTDYSILNYTKIEKDN